MTDGVCGTPGCLRTGFHKPPDECAFWPPKHQNMTSSIQAKENARLIGVIDKLIDERNELQQLVDRLYRVIDEKIDDIGALIRENYRLKQERSHE